MSSRKSTKLWSSHIDEQSRASQPDGYLEPFAINRGGVWFDDGTILLDVEGTHFRVYEGVIALHSPMFQNLPHYLPSDATLCERKFFGHPILVLVDSPQDWVIVLSILFDSSEQRRL